MIISEDTNLKFVHDLVNELIRKSESDKNNFLELLAIFKKADKFTCQIKYGRVTQTLE